MKKNRLLRIAVLLLVVTVPSFAFLQTTMARYTAQATVVHQARVAAWNPIFTYQSGPQADDVVLFTPGRTGDRPFNTIYLQNNSQVTAEFAARLLYPDNTAIDPRLANSNAHAAMNVFALAGISGNIFDGLVFRPGIGPANGRITYRATPITIGNNTAVERRSRFTMDAVQVD